jgi:hypothetical protein
VGDRRPQARLCSAYTWHEDFHLASSVPCPAHVRYELPITASRRCGSTLWGLGDCQVATTALRLTRTVSHRPCRRSRSSMIILAVIKRLDDKTGRLVSCFVGHGCLRVAGLLAPVTPFPGVFRQRLSRRVAEGSASRPGCSRTCSVVHPLPGAIEAPVPVVVAPRAAAAARHSHGERGRRGHWPPRACSPCAAARLGRNPDGNSYTCTYP